MKKIFIALLVTLTAVMTLSAARPTLMLLPDRTWCNENGCLERLKRNGKTVLEENYDEAFLNSTLKQLEVEFKSQMTQSSRAYPVLSYNEVMGDEDFYDAVGELYESGETASGLQSTSFEDLIASKSTVPDLYVKVGWNEEKDGLEKVIAYRLDIIDSYSNKSVASETGYLKPAATFTPVSSLVAIGLRDKMDSWENKLLTHFNDVQTNGREITLDVRIVDNGAGLTFNKEFGGKRLSSIITDWVAENSKNHQYSENISTRNRMNFIDVRVPIRDENNRPQQARHWVTKLQDYLRDNYNIKSENTSSGLGRAMLTLGEN